MGRQREFDEEEVLEAAMGVFWRKGYEGTSYTDLVAAAGVKRPAFYAAFGNKEALFLKALERYDERHLGYVAEALEQPTARGVAAHMFFNTVELTTRDPTQCGCLGVNGVLAGSDEAEPIRQALIGFRVAAQDRMRERFVRAQAEGDLPHNARPDVLAIFVMTTTQGIAVQAKAGTRRELLELVAEQALASWPAPVADPQRGDRPTTSAIR